MRDGRKDENTEGSWSRTRGGGMEEKRRKQREIEIERRDGRMEEREGNKRKIRVERRERGMEEKGREQRGKLEKKGEKER